MSEEGRGRAWRRAQRERAVSKAKIILRYCWYANLPDPARLAERDAPKYADNLKCCSCFMCANRRRLDGPTRKELLAEDDGSQY